MFTHCGIALDSFARIEGECAMTCEVVGDEAQFQLGPSAASLNLVFTQRGLETLLTEATAALAQLRAV